MSSVTTSRFPLPWSSSVAQWWSTSSASPLQIQNEIFSLAPFWSHADHRVAAQRFVTLSGKNRILNEISVKSSDVSSATAGKGNVVLLHGYGAGIGFFFRNLEGLTSSLANRMDFYALDWLGMGLSSRPAFKIRSKTNVEKIAEAESFFLDALEEWRVQRKLEKMTLVAHSLGGYLAVRYTNKYPERVEKLILVSPVGVPKNPYEKSTNTMPDANVNTSAPETSLGAEFSDIDEPVQKNPLPRWVTTLWDANVSPFVFVRFAGPLGPKLTSGWTGRRFSHIPVEQQTLLHNYAYEIFKSKGSGEYALAYLLAPGAYARSCLLDVIPTKVPVLMLYGDRDWMDEGAGRKAAEIANKKVGGDVTVRQISDAGHHCYLDHPKEFDQVVIDFINRPPRKQSV